jgi:hypothetical protein
LFFLAPLVQQQQQATLIWCVLAFFRTDDCVELLPFLIFLSPSFTRVFFVFVLIPAGEKCADTEERRIPIKSKRHGDIVWPPHSSKETPDTTAHTTT